jgi:hypothetical protein
MPGTLRKMRNFENTSPSLGIKAISWNRRGYWMKLTSTLTTAWTTHPKRHNLPRATLQLMMYISMILLSLALVVALVVILAVRVNARQV